MPKLKEIKQEMAKRTIKEKEILEYLKEEGFNEIKPSNKIDKWYKKATEVPSCLETLQEEKKTGSKANRPTINSGG